MNDIAKRYISSAKVLAHVIGIDEKTIISLLGETYPTLYRKFYLPKKNGGKRLILEPIEPLKEVQRAMIPLFQKLEISPICHSTFGRNILTNAEPHVFSRSMLCLDIADAFWSTNFYEYLKFDHKLWRKDYEFSEKTIDLIISLVNYTYTFESQRYGVINKTILPQGAPTSPIAFNLICRLMDERLEKLAQNVGGIVTRYADNICFSIKKETMDITLVNAVKRKVKDAEFIINGSKTKIINNGNTEARPLRLPGVNIMNEDLFLPRKTLRKLRLEAYIAGKTDHPEILQGIRGHALLIMGHWPSQLRGVYAKGNKNKNVLILEP